MWPMEITTFLQSQIHLLGIIVSGMLHNLVKKEKYPKAKKWIPFQSLMKQMDITIKNKKPNKRIILMKSFSPIHKLLKRKVVEEDQLFVLDSIAITRKILSNHLLLFYKSPLIDKTQRKKTTLRKDTQH